MSRIHYWMFVRDEDGSAVQGANVSLYLAESTIPAYVYYSEVGGGAFNTTPQVTTNSEGYFEVWIGDFTEAYGYNSTQKFKLVCEKTGIVSATIDFIDIFTPSSILEVDETSIDETKNKAVSNNLAYGWEVHKNSAASSSPSGGIHGLQPLVLGSTDLTYNKLVNNNILTQLDDFSSKAPSGYGTGMPFVCEHSGNGAVGQVMSFGANVTTGKGIRMPFDGYISTATLQAINIDGTLAVQFYKNGSPEITYQLQVSGSSEDAGTTQYFGTPLEFSAGDIIGLYQSGAPTSATCFNVMFISTFVY